MIIETDDNSNCKFKKNVNMPKAVGRYFIDHYHLFK
jgi:hypothetical protein